MSDSSQSDPVMTKRGLSDRSRELLAGTRRTDELAEEKSPHRVIRSLWWPLLYVVLALGAVDFALAPLFWGARSDLPTEPLIAVCIGLVTVQAFLIAMGIVFGRHSLASRLVTSGALLLIVFTCGTAGYFSTVFTAEVDLGGLRWFAIAGMFWCALISVLVGLVLPMCFVRGVLGWRLTNSDEVRERERLGPEPVNRYTLLDLMVLTAFVALTFGVPRFTYDPQAGRYDDGEFWIVMTGCVLSAIMACGLLLIFAWRQLRPYSEIRPWWTLVTSLGWSLVVTMGVSLGFQRTSALQLAFGWLIWLQAFIGGAIVGLMVLHVHGWRWERAGRPLRTS